MNTKYPENPDPTTEISHLLAMAFMRYRKRQIRKWVKENLENSLDDVPPSGTLRTTENRTMEKGVSRT